MAHRRKKHHRQALARSSSGRFLKRSNPRKRRARARHRRASNPLRVLMANPQRPRRRRRKHTGMVLAHRRRTNPHRKRRHKRRTNPQRHHLSTVRKRRYKRRANPFRLNLGSWMGIVRTGLFGGAGIVTARVGGYLYTKYAAAHIKGDTSDPKSVRAIASELLRLVAMGGAVYVVDTYALKAAGKMARPSDRTAFMYAGYGEAGRQLIGLGVKTFRPSTNLDAYGLSGYSDYQIGGDGVIYGLSDEGRWEALGMAPGMGELVDDSEFAGLVDRESTFGELVDEEEFN